MGVQYKELATPGANHGRWHISDTDMTICLAVSITPYWGGGWGWGLLPKLYRFCTVASISHKCTTEDLFGS